jgi:hypothetical protein
MGTDTVHNQAEDRDKDDKRPRGQWQGETRNSILGSKDDTPATDTATSFQSDQQYPATASDPVLTEYEAQNKGRTTTNPSSPSSSTTTFSEPDSTGKEDNSLQGKRGRIRR